jgi:hypothetical protein
MFCSRDHTGWFVTYPIAGYRRVRAPIARRNPRIVTDKPIRKLYTPTPSSDERTTVPPPFDLEAFARETTAPNFTSSRSAEPPSQSRPKLADPVREEPPSASALLGAIHASVAPDSPQGPDDDRIAAMRECFSWGDYAGALTMADLVLASQPHNVLAREFRANCRATLEDVYAFELGPLDRIPGVIRRPAATGNRAVDQRTGFLLSLMDRQSTLGAIIELCGLPRLDALRVLHDLVQQGIVALK